MRPIKVCRVSNPFAAPGSYMSSKDVHGAAGHHTGIDYAAVVSGLWNVHKPIVRSVLSGEVVISGYNGTMGNWVGVYNHDLNLLVTYWHLSKRLVSPGDWILAWAPVGRVGETGNADGVHLHMQVNRGREFNYSGHLNPAQAMRALSRKTARQVWKRNGGVHPNG